eukprot:TRINITY_DN4653_c0_g3_i2.p1 TRINITY_DN4653_c0_g3~~TRINITY_DN4653_c0_g3_i2.p1  ORF type:complete len:179 (+),score=21.27 TRINITY_DN4653_c0_g3_i2:51-587(+)
MGSMTMEFMAKIYPPQEMDPTLSREHYMKEFQRRLDAYESSAEFEGTKIHPLYGETSFLQKLAYHKKRNELVVVKFWKKGCIPCHARANMFKDTEKWLLDKNPGAVFYSIDIHHPENRGLEKRQLIEGTPHIQKFWNGKQVGGDVQASSKDSLISNLLSTLSSCLMGKPPTNMGFERS